MKKTPVIGLSFWIMKISATTLGETGGDLLSTTLNVGYALSSLILISIFLTTLTAQLAAKKYHPILFWLVILSTSTAGTTLSDYMDRSLGLGYTRGMLILLSLLLAVLGYWYYAERNLSVENIRSRKTEILYWIAILISNTLGTATGDFLADDSGLGFTGGAILISTLLGFLVLIYFTTKASRVALFWLAFVLTRPLGATFGDVLTKPHDKGGLDLGTGGSSLVLFIILIAVLAYSNSTELNDSPEKAV